MLRPVIVESPYAGDVLLHVAYARACVRDSLTRGEAPYASHLFYTQVLDDTNPEERALGIAAGLAWRRCMVTMPVVLGVEVSVQIKRGEWVPGITRAIADSTYLDGAMKGCTYVVEVGDDRIVHADSRDVRREVPVLPAFYDDLGMSTSMHAAAEFYDAEGIGYESRKLGEAAMEIIRAEARRYPWK